MMRRPLSPTTPPSPLVQRFKADPTNIALLEQLVRESRLESARFDMNSSDLYMILATNLVRDVETSGYNCGRESLHLREQYLKGLANCSFQNPHVKEMLVSSGKFMEVVAGLFDHNFELSADLADLIRNLAFNVNSDFHVALAPFVPRLCQAIINVFSSAIPFCEEWLNMASPWHEIAFRNCLNALWNLATHSRHNRTVLCSHPNTLRDVSCGLRTQCHEEASGLLRCIRGTMFSHYSQLQRSLYESKLVDGLLRLLFYDNLKSVENSLLILQDLMPLEPQIVDYIRTMPNIIHRLHELSHSWSYKTSSTAGAILAEHIGQQNEDLLNEEAETVIDDCYLDEDEEFFLSEPPLPDPLTPAANYQCASTSHATYEFTELPLLETPKRSR
uniref:Uncharacterized protein n=1 Tax=Steinernema glaseri TaxID=37863 RepID=A0A1I8A4S6_9BILA